MNNAQNSTPPIEWSTIEKSLSTFTPSSGGFTNAKRGFVFLPSGETVFIKLGIDTSTKLWANKEATIYQLLAKNDFQYIPRLLSINKNATGFALEKLSAEDGWEWETEWSKERLFKTLDAMDSLASLSAADIPRRLLDINMINEHENPWLSFINNPSSRTTLRNMLEKSNKHDLAEDIANTIFLKQAFDFNFSKASLVHNDVRRDNCAWNQSTKQVKLIDWNWLQLGDRRIDVNSVLVNAHKSGLNLTDGFSHRLDENALLWLAGYWFQASLSLYKDNISEVATLKDYQFASAVSAYELALTIR